MVNQTAEETGSYAAVYVGWGTFKNTIIDGMAEGLPNVIDKSIFVGMAGGVQSHLMAGLKFLGLIDDAGRPTEALKKLTSNSEPERKKALGEVLRSRYAALIAIGLDKASMKQFLDTLETKYAVTGDTKTKAARFFIAAAQYAGIALSRHITEGVVAAGRKQPAKRIPNGESRNAPEPPLESGTTAIGEQRVLKLASGGTLTVSASVGFMKLAKADRDFVFGLIDQLDDYESKNPNDPDDEDDQ